MPRLVSLRPGAAITSNMNKNSIQRGEMKRNVFFVAAACIMAVATAAAQPQGNPKAGKAASTTCAACHGADGNSTNPVWPKLAGQGEPYLIKELHDFKSGKRKNAVMSSMAAPLSDKDIANLAAYFASQDRTLGAADPKLVKEGEKIYRGGNAQTGVPACMACHGPAGSGNPQAKYPALGGQHAEYVAAQLKAFRSGARANDPAGMMRTIASRMTDAEIKAVSSYVQGLH